jgi:hypothetical protein
MISSSTAMDVARGVSRLLLDEGYSPILEFTLPSGRRLDVAAIGPGQAKMLGVEIRWRWPDLQTATRNGRKLDYCDLFYFAIPPDFPDEHVPHQATGLNCGGPAMAARSSRKPKPNRCMPAGAEAVTISFARCAAVRRRATWPCPHAKSTLVIPRC